MLSSTPGGTPSQPGMVPGGTGTGVPVHSMAYTETGKASGQGGSQTGSAPGSPAQGSPAQGNAAQGNAAQGSATQGSATQGSATQGSPAQVSAVQGSAAQGSTAQPNPAGGAQLNYPGGAGSQTYGSMPGGTGDTGLSGPQGGFVRSPAGIPDIAVSMGSTFNTSGSADGSSNVGTAGNTGNASTTGNAGNVHNAARGTGELIESILTRLGELQARGPAPEDSTAREAMLSRVHSVLKEAAEVSGKLNLPASLERLSGLLDESGRQEFTDLARLAKSVAGKLEVIQNFNTRADMNLDNPTIVYSSIRFENREEPLRLLVNYRFQNRSRKRDFKTCQVEVRLETPGLGPVSCHITVNDRNLDVQFTVDNEMSAGIIDKFGGVLVRRLEEMEYRVRMPACRVEQGGSSGGIGGELQEVTGLFRIDLQV